MLIFSFFLSFSFIRAQDDINFQVESTIQDELAELYRPIHCRAEFLNLFKKTNLEAFHRFEKKLLQNNIG